MQNARVLLHNVFLYKSMHNTLQYSASSYISFHCRNAICINAFGWIMISNVFFIKIKPE